MRVQQRLMSGLMMVALTALASAADPPADSFEEAVEIARQMDPEAALNMGRELRKRADQVTRMRPTTWRRCS